MGEISSPSRLVARSQRAPLEARRGAAEVVPGIQCTSGGRGWAERGEQSAESRAEEPSEFCLIDTFRGAALNPKLLFFFIFYFFQPSEQEKVCFIHNNMRV